MSEASIPSTSPHRGRNRRWDPQHHRWFDQWLHASGQRLAKLLEETIKQVEQYEAQNEPRVRSRRPGDLKRFRGFIAVLVCNLAHVVVFPSETGRVAILTGGRSAGRTRYDNPSLGSRPVRHVLRMLEGLDLLVHHPPSVPRGEATSLEPTERFKRLVAEAEVVLQDFGRAPEEEVILLTRKTRSEIESAQRFYHVEQIDYRDTDRTRTFRRELRRLNAWLQSADVAFLDDGLEPKINAFDRTLRRHFNTYGDQEQRFDQGGRIFGGFWDGLATERRKNIRINGEPVAVLDFSQMFTRLAYARIGKPAPAGDMYEVEGATGYRSGVKVAMNTLLFDMSRNRSEWPKDLGIGVRRDDDIPPEDEARDYKGFLPAGWTVKKTKEAILKRHPSLGSAWGRGLGFTLMFDESQVLLAALRKLMAEEVPALSLHDGLMVPCSHAELTKKLMEEAALEVTGAAIPASIKN